MGYTISQNIFTQPNAGDDFGEFKLQALVLFGDQSHPWFANDFQALFKELHDDTGRDVVFFAATRTPVDYTTWTHDQDEFKQAQLEARSNLTNQAETLLVTELARRFGLRLEELPAIVIAPRLWAPHYAVIPDLRSADEAAQVLREGIRVAKVLKPPASPSELRELGRLVSRHFLRAHPEAFEIEGRLGKRTASRLNILGATEAELRQDSIPPWLLGGSSALCPTSNKLLSNPVGEVRKLRQRFRNPSSIERLNSEEREERFDEAAMDAAGLLALSASHSIQMPSRESPPWFERLDPASRQMIDTALAVHALLSEQGGRRHDYTPAAAGLWKAVEREFNRSVFQVIRRRHRVPMPEFFDLFHRDSGKIHLSLDGTKLNLNGRLRGTGNRLQWPTLGLGRRLLEYETAQEDKNPLEAELGVMAQVAITPLAESLAKLNKLRNKASHTEPLGDDEMGMAHSLVLDSGLLRDLATVKQSIRGDEPSRGPTRQFEYPPLDTSEPRKRGKKLPSRPRTMEQPSLFGVAPTEGNLSELVRQAANVGADPDLLSEVLAALARVQVDRGRARISPAGLAADLANLIASLSAIQAQGLSDKRWMKEVAGELERVLRQRGRQDG